MWTNPATVVHVIDGDTVVLTRHFGRATLTEPARIAGVTLPDPATPNGEAARVFAATTLPTRTRVMFADYDRNDRHGRPIGAVTLPDGRDYAQLLLAAGHAVPYNT